jgi:heme-degrading monooxygenase HmoA
MTTVETIRFRLREGVDDSDFLRRNLEVETTYMAQRRGFTSRQTCRSADGEYLVIVHWATREDAEATVGAFFGAPETQDFLAAVDVSSVTSGSFELVDRNRDDLLRKEDAR